MGRQQPRSRVDMIIQSESGSRERFSCESETDFVVRSFQYAVKRWASKSLPMRNALAKELKMKLDSFDLKKNASFTIGGLMFMPAQDFAWS